jgi:hypothetical protein
LKNTKTVLDRIEHIFSSETQYRAVWDGAKRATKQLDERYIILQRNALPAVEKVDSPHYTRSYSAQVGGVTDQNTDSEFHLKRAKEHLAMADYLQKQQEEAVVKKMEDRKKVWKELFPEGDCESKGWAWEMQFKHVQIAIDKIISLQNASLNQAHF